MALAAFALALVAFFLGVWYDREFPLLRYFLTLAGLVFVPVVTEVFKTRPLRVRLAILAIPTLGLGLLQLHMEDLISRLSRASFSVGMSLDRERAIQQAESEMRDFLVVEPTIAVKNGLRVDQGFTAKAEKLLVEMHKWEAAFLVDHRDLAETILNAPDDPRYRWQTYKQLVRTKPELKPELTNTLATLEAIVGYLDVADLFRKEIKPQYEILADRLERKEVLGTAACEDIVKTIAKLEQVAAFHRLAGLYNHIGSMAISCWRNSEALGLLYTARSIDPTHITVYEALSYVIWIANNDAINALQVADDGLKECELQQDVVRQDFATANEKYESLARSSPRYASLVNRRKKFLKQEFDKIQPRWMEFVHLLTGRLENDYAYFSALCLKNQKEAFAYARKRYQANPSNASFQDTLGFVTMRFAETISQLDEAERLFILAMRNPKADPETLRLASAHLRELHRYRASLEGRTVPPLTASVRASDVRF